MLSLFFCVIFTIIFAPTLSVGRTIHTNIVDIPAGSVSTSLSCIPAISFITSETTNTYSVICGGEHDIASDCEFTLEVVNTEKPRCIRCNGTIKLYSDKTSKINRIRHCRDIQLVASRKDNPADDRDYPFSIRTHLGNGTDVHNNSRASMQDTNSLVRIKEQDGYNADSVRFNVDRRKSSLRFPSREKENTGTVKSTREKVVVDVKKDDDRGMSYKKPEYTIDDGRRDDVFY